MAAWKPKEKPLTLEEAVALAKRNLNRYWIGSEALLATVSDAGRVTAYPLSPDFAKRDWLLFFIDPTGYSGESALAYTEEWHRRFSAQGLGIIVVLKIPYRRLRAAETLELLLPKHQYPFILVVDPDDQLSLAFGVREAKDLPRVVLIEAGKTVYENSGKDWWRGTEARLQSFLRQKDPGLPLPPVFDRGGRDLADLGGIEFGESSAPATGVPSFRLSGQWTKEGERIVTADPAATIRLKLPGSHLALVAEMGSREPGAAEIFIELDEGRLYDELLGEDLALDENGSAVVKVREGRTYRALHRLPSESRQITLKFLNAKEIPVALYGVRFGE
ncbi:MAG: hypothetical protein NDJ90_11140 [Oligoflexia bacterium]|nr:hypothetical protein [Oligoflexia bacterium]